MLPLCLLCSHGDKRQERQTQSMPHCCQLRASPLGEGRGGGRELVPESQRSVCTWKAEGTQLLGEKETGPLLTVFPTLRDWGRTPCSGAPPRLCCAESRVGGRTGKTVTTSVPRECWPQNSGKAPRMDGSLEMRMMWRRRSPPRTESCFWKVRLTSPTWQGKAPPLEGPTQLVQSPLHWGP